MNYLIICALVILVVILLSIMSKSTCQRSRYWRDQKSALYSVMVDASRNLHLARNDSLSGGERLSYLQKTIASLDAAERFVTPIGMLKIVKIDSGKMREACLKLQSKLE